MISGEEAAAIGLATRGAAGPLTAARTLAREIATRNPHGVRAAKRLLDMSGRVDLATGFAAEQAEIAALIGSANQVEAVTASFEGREPVFTDRIPDFPRHGVRCGQGADSDQRPRDTKRSLHTV